MAVVSLTVCILHVSLSHAQVVIRERVELGDITTDTSDSAVILTDSAALARTLASLRAYGNSGVVDLYARITKVSTHFGWESYGPTLSGTLIFSGDNDTGDLFEATIPIEPQVQLADEYLKVGNCRYWGSSGAQMRGHREYVASAKDDWVYVARMPVASVGQMSIALEYEGERFPSLWEAGKAQVSTVYHYYARCEPGMVVTVYFDLDYRPAPTLKIVPPEEGWQNQFISEAAEMPGIDVQAQLLGYEGDQDLTYEWKYAVAYELPRYTRQYEHGTFVGSKIDICSRKGHVDFADSTKIPHEGAQEVQTWTVSFDSEHVKTANYAGLYWKRVVDRRTGKLRYPGCADTLRTWNQVNGWATWQDENIGFQHSGPSADQVMIGGYVSVEVSTVVAGDTLKAKADSIYQILGKNPTHETILPRLERPEHRAVARMESGGRQFNDARNERAHGSNPAGLLYAAKGYPLYGFPSGYGMKQLDNPIATEMHLWSWEYNLKAGLQYLDNKIAASRRFIKTTDPGLLSRQTVVVTRVTPVTERKGNDNAFEIDSEEITLEEFQWRDIFTRYNAGEEYYQWKYVAAIDEKGETIRNAAGKVVMRWEFKVDSNYGRRAWQYYQEEAQQ